MLLLGSSSQLCSTAATQWRRATMGETGLVRPSAPAAVHLFLFRRHQEAPGNERFLAAQQHGAGGDEEILHGLDLRHLSPIVYMFLE